LTALQPVALTDSWPLSEQARHFELGHVLNSAVTDLIQPALTGELGIHHAGCWECDLADDSLTWSGGIYDIFGLPRSVPVRRDEAVSRYCEHSRARMENLRAYAIKHRRGFTLDVDIHPAAGDARRVRLIAAPVCDGDRVVRLHGLKLII
jgi:PAS domain-containing protein